MLRWLSERPGEEPFSIHARITSAGSGAAQGQERFLNRNPGRSAGPGSLEAPGSGAVNGRK
jgi:hypothetical protein